MIKQLIINGAVNEWIISNRPNGYITFQYNTQNQTLKIIDTYTNIQVPIISQGVITTDPIVLSRIDTIQKVIAGVFDFKGTKEWLSELSSIIDKKVGDVWHVKYDDIHYPKVDYHVINSEFVWATNNEWVELGPVINLSGYYTKDQVNTLFATKQQLNNKQQEIITLLDNISGYLDNKIDNLSTYIDVSLSTNVDDQIDEINWKLNQF